MPGNKTPIERKKPGGWGLIFFVNFIMMSDDDNEQEKNTGDRR
jgi:hypothetical protein